MKIRRRVLVGLAMTAISGCTPPPPAGDGATSPTRITIRGSDTMQPLVRRWAVEYMRRTPDVAIYTEGGGSRRGIEALIEKQIDVCCASRSLSPDEVRRLAERHGTLGVRHQVARDAVGIFVHPENPVQHLSLEQVAAIFTGGVTDWSDVGGQSGEIHVYVREPNSGTRGFLQEHVLRGAPYAPNAEVCAGAPALVRCVAGDRLGVGFGGLGSPGEVHACVIDGVAATPANVARGRYPIARYLYLYTVGVPPPHVKRFLDWVETDEGQAIVAEVGFVPLWP